MNWVDFVLLPPVALGGYIGWRMGSIFAVSCAGAGYVGAWAANRYNPLFLSYFKDFPFPQTLSFIFLFTLVVTGVIVVGWAVGKVLDEFVIGILNHLAGGIAGATIISLLVMVFIFTVISFNPWPPITRNVERSYAAKITVKVAEEFFISPRELAQEIIDRFVKKLPL